MTDTDKIVRQLLLDVEEFGRLMAAHFRDAIGSDRPDAFPSYQKLRSYVLSADKVCNIFNISHIIYIYLSIPIFSYILHLTF